MKYLKKCLIHYADFKDRARCAGYRTFAFAYMPVYLFIDITLACTVSQRYIL